MKVSVVVPTFDRGPGLQRTLQSVLESELGPSDTLEVVVVDDGSRPPARSAVPAALTAPDSTIAWLRQENRGPAAARNAGFRHTSGDVVLFVDDDILVPRGLVAGHLDAHRQAPGAVIFGTTRFTTSRRYLRHLSELSVKESPRGTILVPVRVVSSQHLSVERRSFPAQGAVYQEDLRTPAAEEFELSARLLDQEIPVFLAPSLVAGNDQEVTIEALCRQQFKHGLGAAEAAARYPSTTGRLPELAKVMSLCGPSSQLDDYRTRITKRFKALVAHDRVRGLLAACARVGTPLPGIGLVVRTAVSAHFIAGVRQGIRQFGSPMSDPREPWP